MRHGRVNHIAKTIYPKKACSNPVRYLWDGSRPIFLEIVWMSLIVFKQTFFLRVPPPGNLEKKLSAVS